MYMIIACINHPRVANQTFLVLDDQDLSTVELLEHMTLALGKPLKLISAPVVFFILGAKLVGRIYITQYLFDSLYVEIKKSKDLLSWSPPVSVGVWFLHTAVPCFWQQS